MSNTVEYDILVDVLDAVKDLKKLQQQTKKTKGGLDETKKSGVATAGQIGAAFTGLAAAGAIVVGAVQKVAGAFVDAAQASFDLTRAVVDNINDLNDLSTVSGISAQNIEALKLAFVSSGQSADAANTILQQFPRVLNNIQKGTGDAAKAFEGLGLEARDASGNLKGGDQVFREVIGSLERIEDKTLRAQTATAIFGRSAAGVIQALGAGQFDEFTDSIDRFGSKAGPEASEAAAVFQKRLAAVSFIADRTKQSFVEGTGALGFFLQALKITQQTLAALNTFFQVGQKQIVVFTRVIADVLIFALDALASKILSLVGGPLTGMIRTINGLVKAVTGQDLLGSLVEEVAAFSLEQVGLKDAVNAAIDAFEREGRAIDAATQSTDQNKGATESLDEKVKAFLGTLGESTKKKNKDTKETDKNTKAVKKNTKAENDRRKLIADSLKRMIQASKDISSIQQDANADLLSDLDKINQLEEERLTKLKRITAQQKISTAEVQKAASARAARDRAAIAEAERARAAQANAAAFSGVAGAIGAVSDPSALVTAIGSAFGPVGAGVSQALNALASFGDASQISEERIAEAMEKTGKNRDAAIRQILIDDKVLEYRTFFNAIVNGLKILPDILVKTLPPILLEALFLILRELQVLPFKMGLTILEGLQSIGKAIGDFFKDREFFEALGEAIGNGLKFLFGPLIDAIKDIIGFFTGDSFASGGRFLSAQSGLRFTGQQQGLAMLHQGEMVVPRSGQMSSSVARDVEAQTGGGGITININSAITERSAVDALVRKIERRFGGFGQSTSPLFGGL